MRFTLTVYLKRVHQLGIVLLASQDYAEGSNVMDAAVKYFPFGNRGANGDDGAQADYATAFLHRLLSAPPAK